MAFELVMNGVVEHKAQNEVTQAEINSAEKLFKTKFGVQIDATDSGKLENIIDQAIEQLSDMTVVDSDEDYRHLLFEGFIEDGNVETMMDALMECKLITRFRIYARCVDKFWQYDYDADEDVAWKEQSLHLVTDEDIYNVIDAKIEEEKAKWKSFGLAELKTENGVVQVQNNEETGQLYLTFIPDLTKHDADRCYTFASIGVNKDSVEFKVYGDIDSEKPTNELSLSKDDMIDYCIE